MLAGELYANFGWSAVILYFIYGAFNNVAYAHIKSRINAPGHVYLFYVLLTVLSIRTCEVGLGGVMFLLIIVVFLFALIYLTHHITLTAARHARNMIAP